MYKQWLVETNVPDSELGYRAIVDEDGFIICNPSPMGQANACLISAAQELKDSVELFIKFFDEMPKGQLGRIVCDIGTLNEALITSRQALAKANW